MTNGPIVEEVRRVRRSILKKHNDDFAAMSRDAMRRQWESGHRVVNLGKKVHVAGIAPNIYPISRDTDSKK